ncbi:multidrug efflux pump subunit AcrA (membrane-fusion protein) [Streptomyces sp. PvR006]|uniref:hypothetical protein n=1 Tax=Streptomyces sp. PvR006 TaxID=2817860 RepID=UPI001AE57115|nr:hypothetical protein [Streptomyces sp. PvR006]MBP2582996.1 multidrug efflux pump subunit AcrA (membrane-fusion protein) [Streptomyces sp. PvR006]
MNEAHMEEADERPALPPIWRALSQVERVVWLVAAAGVAGGLAQVTEWTLPLLAVLTVALIEAAVGCYAVYLRLAKARLERTLAEARRETVELRVLAAALSAEHAAREAKHYEMLRYESQLRAEAHAREAAERQRKAETVCLEIRAEHLGLIVERTELKLANIQLRLERTEVWQSAAALRREAEGKLVDAYARGYVAGQAEQPYAGAGAPRHLRLVEDTA